MQIKDEFLTSVTHFLKHPTKKVLLVVVEDTAALEKTLQEKLSTEKQSFFHINVSQRTDIQNIFEAHPLNQPLIIIFSGFEINCQLENIYCKYGLNRWQAKVIVCLLNNFLHPGLDPSLYFAPIVCNRLQKNLVTKIELPIHTRLTSNVQQVTIESTKQSAEEKDTDSNYHYHFLNQKLMTNDPVMMQSYADRATTNELTKRFLFKLIDTSRYDENLEIAASNAITALNYARVPFSGMNFSEIRIPGADLQNGLFDHTDFTRANLKNCNFANAFLRKTNLQNANLEGVYFGELPSLQCQGGANAFYYDSDGHWLAIAGDSSIIIWDTNTFPFQKIQTLPFNKETRSLVGLNNILISGGYNDIYIWNLNNNMIQKTLYGHTGWINCLAISPERQLISGGFDGTIRVWDIQTGECLTVLKGDPEGVYCLIFSPEGQLITGGYDKTIKIWDLKSGKCKMILKGHTGSVSCLKLMTNYRLVSGSWDNTVKVWNLQSGECLKTLLGHTYYVECLAASLDGHLISGSVDKTVRIWDINNDVCQKILRGHKAQIKCLVVTSKGYLVTGSSEKTMKLWDLQKISFQENKSNNSERFMCMIRISDQRIVLGTTSGIIKLLYLESNYQKTLVGHKNVVRCLALSPLDQLVSSGDDGSIRVWNLKNGECQKVFNYYPIRIFSLTFSEDGRLIFGGSDSTIRILELETGECQTILKGHDSTVDCLQVLPEHHLASGSSNGIIKIWNLQTGECQMTLNDHDGCTITSFSLNSSMQLISASCDDTIKIWDLQKGIWKKNLCGYDDAVLCITLTFGGCLISGNRDQTLKVWDMQQAKVLHTLEGYTGAIYAVATNDAGDIFLITSENAIKKWEATYNSTNTITDYQLTFSTHQLQGPLWLEGCQIEGAYGLSLSNRQLLEQWSAMGNPTVRDNQPTSYDHSNHNHYFQPPQTRAPSSTPERNDANGIDKTFKSCSMC